MHNTLIRGYTKASCSYKIWGDCKGRLFRKIRCTPGVVGYPVSVGY